MKKLLSVLSLVLLIAAVLTGCGQGDKSDVSGKSEPVKLKMAMFAFGDTEDTPMVQEALNDLLREKINAEVEIVMINAGTYVEQTNLMLASGEDLDIMPTLVVPTLASYVSNGQFIPLDELLDKYGQGIYDSIALQYIDCTKINGEIYGITTNRDLASGIGFVFRTDMADKYNIDVEKIKKLADVGDVLKIVKQNEPEIYPLVPQQGSAMLALMPFDDLGDPNFLGILADMDKSYNVINYYSSDLFKDWTTTMRSWYADKLIMSDVLNNTETGATLVRNGRAFGYLSVTKPGFDVQESSLAGVDMTVVDLYPPAATTSDVQAIVWAITSNSKYPDKAMQLLNLMYSDSEVSNLLINGIEDVHYKVIDKENNIIGFPEGKDPSTLKYPNGMGWAWPNQFITPVWEGNTADYWEIMDEFNRSARPSDAMGFTFNSDNVATEMAACANIIGQYKDALMAGALDPKDVLDTFNKELELAGVQKIIDEKQSQLNDWVMKKSN